MLGVPRSSGILLSPAALPGRFGMGEIGREAWHWLEALVEMGQTVWWTPPLGPGAFGAEPLCGLAGNPLLVSFDALRNDGALLPGDLALLPAFPSGRIDAGPTAEVRGAFLQLAARRFLSQCEASPLMARAFELFCDRESEWLEDWALFAALRQEQGGRDWQDWPSGLARREAAVMADAMVRLAAEIEEAKVLQFFFHRQWQKVRLRARELGVVLLGDLPLAVRAESCEAWARQELFSPEARGWLLPEAGATEDAEMWWRMRLSRQLDLTDWARLELPPEETAGPLPTGELWQRLRQDLSALPVLMDGTAGAARPEWMAALRLTLHGFAQEEGGHGMLPEEVEAEAAACLGTARTSSVRSFLSAATDSPAGEAQRAWLGAYLGREDLDSSEAVQACVERVLRSPAELALLPLRDVLAQADDGPVGCWRFSWSALNEETRQWLRRETEQAGRL